MKIDYTRIFPGDLSQYISKERLNEIKKEAISKRNVVLRDKIARNEYLSSSAIEFAYINHVNKNKTAVEKAILAANIVFDDEKMARILEDNNFDINTLNSYIRLLNYLKAKNDNCNQTNIDIIYNNKVNIITSKLISAVNTYMGSVNPNLIINKIVELLSFRPELILNKTEIIFKNLNNHLQTELHKIEDLRYVYYITEKENNKEITKYHFILYGDNVEANNLIKLASIVEIIKSEFKNKHAIVNVSISSVKDFKESDEVNYLYYNNKSKIKIKKA